MQHSSAGGLHSNTFIMWRTAFVCPPPQQNCWENSNVFFFLFPPSQDYTLAAALPCLSTPPLEVFHFTNICWQRGIPNPSRAFFQISLLRQNADLSCCTCRPAFVFSFFSSCFIFIETQQKKTSAKRHAFPFEINCMTTWVALRANLEQLFVIILKLRGKNVTLDSIGLRIKDKVKEIVNSSR